MIYSSAAEYFFYTGIEHSMCGKVNLLKSTTLIGEMYNWGLLLGEILELDEFYDSI